MKDSLADSLRVVLPALSAALATTEARQTLLAAAEWLPPIALGGLEFRLGAGSQQVDLLQCIRVEAGLPEILRAHLEAAPEVFQNEWSRIRDFCAVWADPASSLHAAFHNIWLEFDLDGQPAAGQPVPSVFLALNPKLAKLEIQTAVKAALGLLAGRALPAALLGKLEACFQACEAPVRVNHVGVMLPRAMQGLRVNVQGLDLAAMLPYLQRVGWRWPAAELEALLADLFEQVGYITLGLDIGEQILPRLGLECGFGEQPEREPRWSHFLEALVGRGLVAAPRAEALLDWPGSDVPPAAEVPWPGQWIVASLARPPDEFSLLGRRLSHIKLVYQPGQPLEAKGYIGFGHLWSKTADFKRLPATRAETMGCAENSREAAIAQGIGFLLGSRSPAGWWEDFLLPAGPSDEWVTAYVGTALAHQANPKARGAAQAAWAQLGQRRGQADGWGYCASTPVDADSTGWAVQLAGLIGAADSTRAAAARRGLEEHLRPDGGIATYSTDGPIRRWMGSPPEAPFEGWLVSHPCVTAAVAAIAGFAERTRDYLRRTQLADGSWRAYWWCDHEYATALAAEALAAGGAEADGARIARAVEWARSRLNADGSAAFGRHAAGSTFATAWCLRTLRLGKPAAGIETAAEKAERWLLGQQRLDGSWAGCARLRVPPPAVLDPDSQPEGTLVSPDSQRNFTTASVLMALRIGGGG